MYLVPYVEASPLEYVGSAQLKSISYCQHPSETTSNQNGYIIAYARIVNEDSIEEGYIPMLARSKLMVPKRVLGKGCPALHQVICD